MSSRNDNAYAEWRAEQIEDGDPIGWTVETCKCGFGGGDVIWDFGTKDEALGFVRDAAYEDFSIVAVRDTDGNAIPEAEWTI